MEQLFDVVIIGAGFSGTSISYLLRDSDKRILILDQGNIAHGASGNPKAHMVPYLTAPLFPGHEFYNEGFQYSADLLQALHNSKKLPSYIRCDALQFPSNDRPTRLVQQLSHGATPHAEIELVSPEDLQNIYGFHGILPNVARYKETYVIDPRELCNTLVTASNAVIKTSTDVQSVVRKDSSSNFNIHTAAELYESPIVIIAVGSDTKTFLPLPIKPLRGQVVTGIPQPPIDHLTTPLCYNGYYLPSTPFQPYALIGSTYDRNDFSLEPTEEKNQEIYQKLLSLPLFHDSPVVPTPLTSAHARVSFRAVTKDRLPIIGEVSKGYYICAGHGSRGLHSAPIGAQLIVDMILKKPLSEQQQRFARLLSPLRVGLRT